MQNSPEEVDYLTKYLGKMSLNNNTPSINAAKAIADFLPTFDGNSEQLESFLSRCDKFYDSYGKTTDNGLNDFVFNVICSKLRNDVSNFLMCRPDINTWPQIKISLRQHFGDKIDRQTLIREFLQLLKNKNETILDFLEKLKQMKSRIEVKIQTDETLTNDQKVLLINQNELNALDILTANSDDNLRLLLDIKQPVDLSDAYDLVIKHFHNQSRINALTKRHEFTRQTSKIQNMSNFKQNINPQTNMSYYPRINYQSFPRQFTYNQQNPSYQNYQTPNQNYSQF